MGHTNFALSRVRDFSCDESDFESPVMKIDSLESFQHHWDDHPNEIFQALNRSRPKPAAITDQTKSPGAHAFYHDRPLISSAEYHDDIVAMHILPSVDCEHPGLFNSDAASRPHFTGAKAIQIPSMPLLSNRSLLGCNMDLVDQSASTFLEGKFQDEMANTPQLTTNMPLAFQCHAA